jgi:hypothetical protein
VKRLHVGALLVAWCLVIIVPGILWATGYFGDGDEPKHGANAWFFGGYLVQIGLFIVIARIANANARFTWWLVVSLLPFLVWVVSVESPAAGAASMVVTVGFAAWVYRRAVGDDDLQQHGIQATGTVLEVVQPRFFNEVLNAVYIKRTLRLQIARADGTPSYEAKYKGLFMIGDIPDPGDQLTLRVDPDDPDRFAVQSRSRAQRRVQAAAPPSDTAARLRDLDTLRKQGLVTDEEYQAQRRAIIASV